MNDREKYDLSRQAQKSGGPCPLCDWKDGDGVRTCFYSSELGIVTHQNTERGILASMDASQRNLYQGGYELVYLSEEYRERHIKNVEREHRAYVQRMLASHQASDPDYYPVRDRHDQPISIEDWVAHYAADQKQKHLATDPKYAGWIQEPWWEYRKDYPPQELCGIEKETPDGTRFVAWMTHLYAPHLCGRGHRYQIEPYHFGCTGCGTEIKLWEHGVDYDIG